MRPDILDLRREIVERPFGAIQHWIDQGAFLMKGFDKVPGEFSPTALAYNLMRAIAVCGAPALIEGVRPATPLLSALYHSTKPARLNGMNRLLVAVVPVLLAAAPTGPTLGPLRLQLYYKSSGTLSGNVASPAKLSFWNTGAGEGDVKEPAEDLLVSVPIQMPTGRDMGQNSEVPLTITVRTRGGKLLGSRTFRFISIPYKDPVWSPLWVNSIQCAGPIIATATWGKQRRTAAISLGCGE